MCRLRAEIHADLRHGERAVRDLAWSGITAAVFVEVYRVQCPDCGVKREKVPLLPGKAPFSKRFEDAVGLALRQMGVDEIDLGKKQKFLSPANPHGAGICRPRE
jgi:transposase